MKSIRGKSAARKPLGDISNCGRNTLRSRKKSNKSEEVNEHDCGVDRLLLVRSDLASVVAQIDEIIARAIENKGKGIKANQDIDSLRSVLSDMHASLKPWLSKLQQSLDTAPAATQNQLIQSKETKSVSGDMEDEDAVKIERNQPKPDPELELAVSPSPLVSWRAGTCMVDCGKQLFLLTPLPKNRTCSSKCPGQSKSALKIFFDRAHPKPHELPPSSFSPTTAQHYLARVEEKPAPIVLSEPCSFGETSDLQLSTPCLPRSSGFLNPIIETHPDVEISELPENNNVAELFVDLDDEHSNRSITNNLNLFGGQILPGFANRRKEVCETLDWFLSPLKTCKLLETSDEKSLPTTPNVSLSFSTPFNLESTQKEKLLGETTLKRELWTKFEAASSNHLSFDASIFQKEENEGFLHKLDEVAK
ncbi:uncharacterized protein LOC121987189 [Zingiber officinale]|uniref:Uncharacterized protein n=1 Tax=Zingiber officinale TaxID=94328 RepID=A0A8J5GDW2_ZINOF|nr:uncharacterized protein LOC121987189 [Zingiber officinale]KAG6502514.1 hypothetical protein ZIOFF_034795 [Zingiber officinale]